MRPARGRRDLRKEDQTMKACPEIQKTNFKERRLQLPIAIVALIVGGLFYGLMPEDSRADPRTSTAPLNWGSAFCTGAPVILFFVSHPGKNT
jgi:hypothetical protein